MMNLIENLIFHMNQMWKIFSRNFQQHDKKKITIYIETSKT